MAFRPWFESHTDDYRPMSVERTFRCDGPDCERHMVTQKVVPEPFLTVERPLDDLTLHFCGWDCVLRYAGQIEPETVIYQGDEPDD